MMPDSRKVALVVAFNFPPSANVGVFRTLRFTRFLPESGWNTAVLTSTPSPDGPLDAALAQMIPPGVQVRQIPLRRPEEAIKQTLRAALGGKRPAEMRQAVSLSSARNRSAQNSPAVAPANAWRKKLTELLFAIPDDRIGWKRDAVLAGLEMARQLRPSVILASGPPFSTLLVGRELARRTGLPLVLDFRDPWTRVPWGPRNKSSLANSIVAKLERRCVTSAAKVVLNTPQLEEDFVSHYRGLPRDRFLCIPNGYDPEIRSKVAAQIEREAIGRFEKRVPCLLHPGSLYRNRNPRPIVEALAHLHAKGIEVVFEQIGSCEYSSQLMAYAEQLGIASLVRILPAVPHDELLKRMADVDGFILLQPGTALQVPGKLFEMILFRKPIVAICEEGAVADIINNYRIGQVAPSGDVEQIADAMQRASAPATAAARWDDVLRDFDGRQLSAKLADVFDSVRHN